MSTSNIRHAHITAASNIADLDEACLALQERAGITDGGVASLVLGPQSDRWPRMSPAEREGWLRAWLWHEQLYEREETQ